MMTVAKNCVVSMRYIMTNREGAVLENTMNSLPVSYLHGAHGILPLLQEQLEGLKAGDRKQVYLTAAPGLTGEDFIFEVIVDEVRPALDEEIFLGYPVQANVQPCEAGCDCYRERSAEHG
jgi:FKBP-type peptidyl-prolyl cis-trans isomerase SlyD